MQWDVGRPVPANRGSRLYSVTRRIFPVFFEIFRNLV
jgi:hypothetical protein